MIHTNHRPDSPATPSRSRSARQGPASSSSASDDRPAHFEDTCTRCVPFPFVYTWENAYTTLEAVLGLGVLALLDELAPASVVLRPLHLQRELLHFSSTNETNLHLGSVHILDRLFSRLSPAT